MNKKNERQKRVRHHSTERAMNTATAVISPETSPRSIKALSKIGIFQIRLLIDKLGGLQTPEQKQAFAGLTSEEKVRLAARLLAAWDDAHGRRSKRLSARATRPR